MVKDIYAHFPPWGKEQEAKEVPPKAGDVKKGVREVPAFEVFIPAGWYSYNELIKFCAKIEREQSK